MMRNKKITNLILLIRLILFIAFIAHIFGLLWTGLATLTLYRYEFKFQKN